MKKVIATMNAPQAIGPYSQAIFVGNMLFASGQLGLVPATGNFAEGGIKEQTAQAFQNVKAILAEAGLTMDQVVNAQQFSGALPARSAVAVKTLPKNALVEIEVIAVQD